MPPSTASTKGLTSKEVLKSLLGILRKAEDMPIPVPDMDQGAQWAFYIEHAMQPGSAKEYVQAGLVPYLHDILKRFTALKGPLNTDLVSETLRVVCGAQGHGMDTLTALLFSEGRMVLRYRSNGVPDVLSVHEQGGRIYSADAGPGPRQSSDEGA